jgi:hypothetical protein
MFAFVSKTMRRRRMMDHRVGLAMDWSRIDCVCCSNILSSVVQLKIHPNKNMREIKKEGRKKGGMVLL